jgi:hypothetical protein
VSFAAGVANRLCLAAAVPAHRRLERALRDPAAAQRRILERILGENAQSAFGCRHGFADMKTVAEFRARVPSREYDELAADIRLIAGGARDVLTTHDVVCFEATTGSSRAAKLVPYTRALLREFSAGTLAWIYDLLAHRPAMRDGRAYWAVTPPARPATVAATRIPIGMDHDSDYFPSAVRALLDRVLGTPRALSRAPNIDAARYLTLRVLVAIPDLAFISVWNPSFLSLLADALDDFWPHLLCDMETGRLSLALDDALRGELSRALPARPSLAAELRRRFHRRPPEDLGELWTKLAMISCWTEAHAGRALAGMTRRFPRVEVQGKGLLATEGVVTIPLIEANGCVPAVTSHFLEFVPNAAGDNSHALGVEELEVGQSYEVLLTTSGGLYRYQLKDVVRVEGRYKAVPLLSFRGRADRTSDLVGEKLSASFVEHAIQAAVEAAGVRPQFAMLAPVWGEPPRYELFVECDIAASEHLARALEMQLAMSHHYALCRRLGQLGGVRAVAVRDAERTYERVCVSRGQRAGAIKPTALDERLGWDEEFSNSRDRAVVA